MRNVLVTGATGTVGGALVARLLGEGVRVRALVRSAPRAAGLLPPGVAVAVGDVTDPASVRAAVRGCDTVFHTAGLPEQWLRDPEAFTRVNTDGTRHLVAAALAEGVECFVHTSTIDVFERAPGRPFDESRLAARPLETPYERSKQEADRLVTAAVAEDGLPARTVHPSAVHGPGPAVVTMNNLLDRLRRNQVPMLPPGGMSVVFSEDVAAGQLLAAAAPVGSRFILSDRYLTMREIAETVAGLFPGVRVPRTLPGLPAALLAETGELFSRLTGRPPLLATGELHFLRSESVADATRARVELGWRATPFADALARTLAALDLAP
ncbi:NAD-dependent epimerase/dehydratase family protein [Kitasatospora sp. NPDC049258]|uniref:NAD-dependent epimerase/dehydratase family protein n=1 Tax=Kitasatospora sp. NPDC049258 TaxID=3155394 RepID=UPI0034308F50